MGVDIRIPQTTLYSITGLDRIIFKKFAMPDKK